MLSMLAKNYLMSAAQQNEVAAASSLALAFKEGGIFGADKDQETYWSNQADIITQNNIRRAQNARRNENKEDSSIFSRFFNRKPKPDIVNDDKSQSAMAEQESKEIQNKRETELAAQKARKAAEEAAKIEGERRRAAEAAKIAKQEKAKQEAAKERGRILKESLVKLYKRYQKTLKRQGYAAKLNKENAQNRLG